MHYLLFYETVEDYVEKRAPHREGHLEYAKAAHDRGELFLAGALAEPADGAVLVFKGDGPSVAEDFAKNDPYVKNGLISKWTVRPWTVVIGG
ncbi:MAG: YciI-like protein [Planctomycetota bacterium]